MTDAKAKWTDVGDQLNELGLKLKLHLEQAAPDGAQTDGGPFRDALQGLADAVEQGFDALGNAARDEAVRADVKDAGRALVEALDATFEEVAERVRTR